MDRRRLGQKQRREDKPVKIKKCKKFNMIRFGKEEGRSSFNFLAILHREVVSLASVV